MKYLVGMTMNSELNRIWKEAVVTYFKIGLLSVNLH